MSLADAVQLGMDSKITDIDCVADSFRNGTYINEEVPENIKKDVERLLEIIIKRNMAETDQVFLHHPKERRSTSMLNGWKTEKEVEEIRNSYPERN